MKKLFHVVLTISILSCITRALGFVFRIYLSRELGAEALGSYQVAISVFVVLCTLIASGLPVILSREISKHKANNQQDLCSSSVGSGLVISLTISLSACAIILLFPNLISFFFTDKNSISVLFFLLPGVIASAIFAAFRGALWGHKHLVWLEITELIEQVARMILCFLSFKFFYNILPKNQLAGISLSISCIISCIMVAIIFFALGYKIKSPKPTLKQITLASTPITAMRSLSSLVTSLIAIIIPIRLVLAGISNEQALAEFGIMSGMTLPLLTIPGTVIGSLAVALTPELSANASTSIHDPKKRVKIKNQINNAITVSVVLSFVLFPIYLVLGKELGLFLFNNTKAGTYLILSCWIMVPMGVCQITNCVLNSIGKELKSLINYAAGAIFMFASIFFLPKYVGINSLIIGTGSMYVVTAIMNLLLLKKEHLLSKSHITTFFYMIAISVFCASFSRFAYNITAQSFSAFWSITVSCLVSFVSLFVLVIVFNIADLSSLLIRKKKV